MVDVIILRGIPGAGKSTWAKEYAASSNTPVIICSADDYFVNENGEYKFDATQLQAAHSYCKNKFAKYLYEFADDQDRGATIIVDNTNTRISEFSYYMHLAQRNNAHVTVRRFIVDPEVAYSRGVHKVPYDIVVKMFKRMKQQIYAPEVLFYPPSVQERENLVYELHEGSSAADSVMSAMKSALAKGHNITFIYNCRSCCYTGRASHGEYSPRLRRTDFDQEEFYL
jgi:predicted kinase